MMTIGQVSRKTDISCYTIRYYIEIGLIVPIKHNDRYDFSDQDVVELLMIKKLKSFEFSLAEIHNIISLRRSSYIVSKRELNEYVNLLKNKKMEIIQKLDGMKNSLRGIDELINQAKVKTHEASVPNGIPIDFLNYFICPKCNQNLELNHSSIQGNKILKGFLKCNCGYGAVIKNGILICGEKTEDVQTMGNSLLSQYDAKTISVNQKAAKRIYDALSKTDLKNKLVIETNIDRFFYLLMNIKCMETQALYIIVDPSINVINFYKKQLDQMQISQKVIFLVTSDFKLPLKMDSIDVWIDYFDSNIHAERKKDLLPEILSSYLKKGAKVYGSIGTTPHNAPYIQQLFQTYPIGNIRDFIDDRFFVCLKNLGFTLTHQEHIDYLWAYSKQSKIQINSVPENLTFYEAVYDKLK